MKIPFDIKYRPQIESGEYKVETRNGLPVRIICWDRKFGYPIVGLAYEKATGCESYVSAYADGTTSANGKMELSDDLFLITPEPGLSEFEKALSKCICDALVCPEEDYDKWAKEYAPELLELARKELVEEHLTPDPELTEFELRLLDWLSSDTCGEISMDEMKKCVKNRAAELRQELAKEHGNDLPRWKNASAGTKLPSESIISREGDDPRFGSVAVYDCKYITVGELEKLPKEDEK